MAGVKRGQDNSFYVSFDTLDNLPVECDWGSCNDTPVGARWDRLEKRWLPVCERHTGGRGRLRPDDVRKPYPIERGRRG